MIKTVTVEAKLPAFSSGNHHDNFDNIFYEHGLTLIPAWISNYMPRNVWDKISYPFLNFNSATVEVKELIRNFIPHFTGACDYLYMLGLKLIHVSKQGRWSLAITMLIQIWLWCHPIYILARMVLQLSPANKDITICQGVKSSFRYWFKVVQPLATQLAPVLMGRVAHVPMFVHYSTHWHCGKGRGRPLPTDVAKRHSLRPGTCPGEARWGAQPWKK